MKVLFIGLGGIGQRHLRNFISLIDRPVEIFAFREVHSESVITNNLAVDEHRSVTNEYPIRVFTDIKVALSQCPDVTFICNPTSKHVEFSLLAAKAGSHVFIEKALSNSMDNVDELIRVVSENNLISHVGYQMRFHPLVARLKHALHIRLLGKLINVEAYVGEYMPGWHKYEDYRTLYASRKDLGGGVVISQIHEIDIVQWLFGYPKLVFSLGGKLSDLHIDVEDIASSLLLCDIDGRSLPVHLHQDFLQSPTKRYIKLIGTLGTLYIDFTTQNFQHWDSQGNLVENTALVSFDRNALFIDQMRYFLNCIDNGRMSELSVAEGKKSLQIALAIKQSMETLQPIRLC